MYKHSSNASKQNDKYPYNTKTSEVKMLPLLNSEKLTVDSCDTEVINPVSAPEFTAHISKNDPTELARAAAALLSQILKNYLFIKNYRIEWRVEKKLLVLTIEPIAWYLQILKVEERVSKARGWVASIKQQSMPTERHVNGTTNSTQAPIVKPKAYCDWTIKCEHIRKPNGCTKQHTKQTCVCFVEKMDGSSSPCGWFSYVELQINELFPSDFFIVQTRVTLERELLILPAPLPFWCDENNDPHFCGTLWKGHYTNKELAKMPFFWENVLLVIEKIQKQTGLQYPVEVVALNFGKWESKMAQDAYSKECHGHAHLILSDRAQGSLAHKFPPMRGRFEDPKPYIFEDALYLESHYLLPDEVSSLAQSQQETKNTLQEILGFVKGLEEKIQNFKPLKQGLSKETITPSGDKQE